MFDLIVGVSTGAIIATMIGAKGMSIAETKEAYLRDCTRVFNHSIMHRIWNFGGRLANLSNSTKMWTDVLKQVGSGSKIALTFFIDNSLDNWTQFFDD